VLGNHHPATVHLVGSGPGDPELLTRKALRLLESADVVLHDALVSPEILALIPAHTEKIDVGKRAGTKFLTQQDINSLLVAAAQNPKNKIVVRLKGGDPSLFGRATEELDALRAANIPFEIVPGISAAFAAAAAAKISLTDRRIASHVLFTTFSRSPEAQLLPLIGLTPDTTVAIYMPGTDYAHVSQYLIDSGFTAETPCVVVSRASHQDQTEHRTTVAALAQQESLPAPSLLLVGRVVAHHTTDDAQSVANEILTWRSDANAEPAQIFAAKGKPQ
jgi:uroporphyrin-III C-methyltransferase